jgi:hypothetical protein
VDDGAAGVTWRYEQRRGAPRAHGVEVSVLAKSQWLAGEIAALAADACSTRSTGAPQDEPTQSGAKVRRGRRVAPKPSQRPRP